MSRPFPPPFPPPMVAHTPPDPAQDAPHGQSLSDVFWQMGDIGHTALKALGINPFGTENPEDYVTARMPDGKFVTLQKKMGMMPVGPGNVEGLYSKAAKILEESPQQVFGGDQLINFLKAKGVRDEEIKWSGLEELGRKPKVRKDEAFNAIKSSPTLSEKILSSNGDPKIQQEIDQLRQKIDPLWDLHQHLMAKGDQESIQKATELDSVLRPLWDRYQELGELNIAHHAQYDNANLKLPGPHSNYREILIQSNPSETPFQSSHYPEHPNLVAHLRVDERPTADGGKAIHAEEVQSDWANTASKQGIKDPKVEKRLKELDTAMQENLDSRMVARLGGAAPEVQAKLEQEFQQHLQEYEKLQAHSSNKGVPDAPYIRGGWNELAAKRLLLEGAKDPSATDVTWTTGQQQADRYSMDKHFHKIEYDPETQTLNAYPKNGEQSLRAFTPPHVVKVAPEDLPEQIGPELTNKLLNSEPIEGQVYTRYERGNGSSYYSHGKHVLSEDDLKFEDKGKRDMYDVAFKSNIKKLTKQEPKLIDVQGENFYTDVGPKLRTYTPGITAERFRRTPFIVYDEVGQLISAHKTREEAEAVLQHARKVYEAKNPSARQKVWGIKMTPELRAKILKEGFPLFAAAGAVGASAFKRTTKEEPLPPPPPMLVGH